MEACPWRGVRGLVPFCTPAREGVIATAAMCRHHAFAPLAGEIRRFLVKVPLVSVSFVSGVWYCNYTSLTRISQLSDGKSVMLPVCFGDGGGGGCVRLAQSQRGTIEAGYGVGGGTEGLPCV